MPSSRLSRSLLGALKNISLNVISDIKVNWYLTGEKSPVESIFDGITFFEFSNLDSQEIHTEIRIPNNYVSGKPIRLVSGSFFTNEVLGNVRFTANISLIRPSETVQGQYNTVIQTSVEINVDETSKEFTQIDEIPLSTVDGLINGVAIKAKDILKVKLYRDIDNETVPCNGSVYLMKESFIAKAI